MAPVYSQAPCRIRSMSGGYYPSPVARLRQIDRESEREKRGRDKARNRDREKQKRRQKQRQRPTGMALFR